MVLPWFICGESFEGQMKYSVGVTQHSCDVIADDVRGVDVVTASCTASTLRRARTNGNGTALCRIWTFIVHTYVRGLNWHPDHERTYRVEMCRGWVAVLLHTHKILIPHSRVVTICTTSLTFNNSTFCPHSVFMCFVCIWEQTAIISLYNINWLAFITQI